METLKFSSGIHTSADASEAIAASRIRNLARGIYRRYLSRDVIYERMICGNHAECNQLDLLQKLYQSIETSLEYGQLRRAVWYLGIFNKLCKRIFSKKSDMIVLQFDMETDEEAN